MLSIATTKSMTEYYPELVLSISPYSCGEFQYQLTT